MEDAFTMKKYRPIWVIVLGLYEIFSILSNILYFRIVDIDWYSEEYMKINNQVSMDQIKNYILGPIPVINSVLFCSLNVFLSLFLFMLMFYLCAKYIYRKQVKTSDCFIFAIVACAPRVLREALKIIFMLGNAPLDEYPGRYDILLLPNLLGFQARGIVAPVLTSVGIDTVLTSVLIYMILHTMGETSKIRAIAIGALPIVVCLLVGIFSRHT